MKKQIIFASLVLVLTSCGVGYRIFSPKNERLNDFSVVHNTVYYKNKPFAELQAMTWSLDNDELVREMNFKLLEKEDLNIIGDMIDYLSERHKGDEIEIEFEVEHNSDRFKL
jgi:hypothetical protein